MSQNVTCVRTSVILQRQLWGSGEQPFVLEVFLEGLVPALAFICTSIQISFFLMGGVVALRLSECYSGDLSSVCGSAAGWPWTVHLICLGLSLLIYTNGTHYIWARFIILDSLSPSPKYMATKACFCHKDDILIPYIVLQHWWLGFWMTSELFCCTISVCVNLDLLTHALQVLLNIDRGHCIYYVSKDFRSRAHIIIRSC